MLITVVDLERAPIEFDQPVQPGTIQYGSDVKQLDTFRVTGRADMLQEHRGPRDVVADIRIRAHYEGRFEVPCARCVEPVNYDLAGDFDLLFRPVGADGEAAEHSITTSETEIGYYQGGSLELEDVLREQVLLSLPAKTLCRQDCKGLCPRCGINLNTETCTCGQTRSDPRWTALSDLRSRIKL